MPAPAFTNRSTGNDEQTIVSSEQSSYCEDRNRKEDQMSKQTLHRVIGNSAAALILTVFVGICSLANAESRKTSNQPSRPAQAARPANTQSRPQPTNRTAPSSTNRSAPANRNTGGSVHPSGSTGAG